MFNSFFLIQILNMFNSFFLIQIQISLIVTDFNDGLCTQLHHFNETQLCRLLEVFHGLCINLILCKVTPHKEDREVSPCPGDQLHDAPSVRHGHHLLGFPAKEVLGVVAFPGSSCLLPLLLRQLLNWGWEAEIENGYNISVVFVGIHQRLLHLSFVLANVKENGFDPLKRWEGE